MKEELPYEDIPKLKNGDKLLCIRSGGGIEKGKVYTFIKKGNHYDLITVEENDFDVFYWRFAKLSIKKKIG